MAQANVLTALQSGEIATPEESQLSTIVAEPPRRKPGRPPGMKTRTDAELLRRHHFAFLRATTEGVALRKAWELYLSGEGGPDDERHFVARLRRLDQLVRVGAEAHGLAEKATLALAGLDRLWRKPPPKKPAPDGAPASPALPSPPAASPAAPTHPAGVPTLDEWVGRRCADLGIEADFQTQAEWLAEYRDEYGLDQPVPVAKASVITLVTRPAPASPDGPASPLPALQERLDALNQLAATLAKPPALRDPLGAWLAPDLADRLSAKGVLTLNSLIDYVNLEHHRWWRSIDGLGQLRADRVLAWLAPLASALGHPVRDVALRPWREIELLRQDRLSRLDPESLKRFGLVPLERLHVPLELDGHNGVFRTGRPNTLGAETDLQAIWAWLKNHQDSRRTHASYKGIVERFYLWCLLVKRKPLSSLVEGDFHDYRAFLETPPADWIQEQRASRDSEHWRPFKKRLEPTSQKLNLTVVSALLSRLVKSGYLTANAASMVTPLMKLPALKMNIGRTFDEAQWQWVMQCWSVMYLQVGPIAEGEEQPLLPDAAHPDRHFQRAAELRRTRLLLELGATTGMRRIEICTTRRRALERVVVEGEAVWIAKVVGKGNKEREVLLFDDVKALLDQHHLDMARAGTDYDPSNNRKREILNPMAVVKTNAGALPCPGQAEDLPAGGELPSKSELVLLTEDEVRRGLPLIGALRKAPRRRTLDQRGLAVLEDEGHNADVHGSLDPTAMAQAFRRFLQACAAMGRAAGVEIDVEKLERGTPHFLRHTFANNAAADGVLPVALMGALGHSSLEVTSPYLHPERKLIVREMSRMRRRT